MEKLVRGIHEFQATHFNEHQELFAKLSKGQEPETLMITCSDSRIVPDLLTQTLPGELFVGITRPSVRGLTMPAREPIIPRDQRGRD